MVGAIRKKLCLQAYALVFHKWVCKEISCIHQQPGNTCTYCHPDPRLRLKQYRLHRIVLKCKAFIVPTVHLAKKLINPSLFPEIVPCVVHRQNSTGWNVLGIGFYIIVSVYIKLMIRCGLPLPRKVEITVVCKIDVCFSIGSGFVTNRDFIVIRQRNSNPELHVARVAFLAVRCFDSTSLTTNLTFRRNKFEYFLVEAIWFHHADGCPVFPSFGESLKDVHQS